MQNDKLTRPKQVLVWSFVVSLAATAGFFYMTSNTNFEEAPIEPFLGLVLVMCAAGLAFYISLGVLASRLGRSPIVWVGLAFIFGPFGAIGTFVAMLSHVKDELSREASGAVG